MSSFLGTSKLIDNCTPSIGYDNQVKAASGAIDKQCYEIITDTGEVLFIPNIMGLTDSNLVDILAWQFHVDFYDASRDIEFRKRLVQMSIIWHKTKGTVALVQDVLDTYWPHGATISEWFDYEDPLPPARPPNSSGPLPEPNWHDRYRFRILTDVGIIKPSDEQAVLNLINHYKPISRWCEGVYRARSSQCNIGWTGMLLRFIYRDIAAPTNYRPPPRQAETYQLVPPASGGGMAAEWSDHFYVALDPGTGVADVVIVTLSDGDMGGVFIPPSVRLTTDVPMATFQYNPPAVTQLIWISTENDGELDDPPAVAYQSKQRVYTLTGPTSGGIGYESTPFTITLEPE